MAAKKDKFKFYLMQSRTDAIILALLELTEDEYERVKIFLQELRGSK